MLSKIMRSGADLHIGWCQQGSEKQKKNALFLRSLRSDLGGRFLRCIFARTAGEPTKPSLNCSLLLGTHVFKHYSHAENSKTASRMQIDHFAAQFARAYAIRDPQVESRVTGNRFKRINITTTRTQFGNLCVNACPIAKRNFGIREKRKPGVGALHCVGTVSHGVPPGTSQILLNPLY